MICWGGLSFVTVAASGWQMVWYGSNGGNLVKGKRADKTVERYGIDRERTYACRKRPCEMLHFEGTRMRYLASRLDEREGKVKEDKGGEPTEGCSLVSST